jgi:hypothetical protein
MTLEKLNFAFVPFGSATAAEGAQVLAVSVGIGLA